MNEFKDQLDATEKDKVAKHIAELREIAAKGQAGDGEATADAIREKINETQQASLGLFQKVSRVVPSSPFSLTLFCRSMKRRTLRAHRLPLRRRIRRKRRRTKLFRSSHSPPLSPVALLLCCPSRYFMTLHDIRAHLEHQKYIVLLTTTTTISTHSRMFIVLTHIDHHPNTLSPPLSSTTFLRTFRYHMPSISVPE